MNFPDFININKDWAYGSIELGDYVVCDGLAKDNNDLVVYTHAHEDHVNNNLIAEAYKKNINVVMTEITRELCSSYMTVNLDYDFNLKVIPSNELVLFDNVSIKLLEAKHILGSSQIEVHDKKYGKIGYSGDFGEEVNEVIDVDFLVLDSTYSGDFKNRKWTMEEALSRLVEDIKTNVGKQDINLIADSGLLQFILHHLNIWSEHPTVITGKKEKGWSTVYSKYQYNQPKNFALKGSDEERELKMANQSVITIGHDRSILNEIPKGLTYIVKNIGIENEEPINEINENLKRVGLSSHATGTSVIDYVEKVNPSYVITDSSRSSNNAKKLSELIGSQLGIPSIAFDQIQNVKV